MALADWTALGGGLDANTLRRGVIEAGAVSGGAPNGGGSFIYGYNSLAATAGAAGLFVADADFAPADFGASIKAAVKRGPSAGLTGWSPFIFIAGQGASVNDNGYLLGLEDDDPHKIVLRKGRIGDGVPSDVGSGVLRASTASFANNVWHHLRLDAIVNENGDVVIRVFRNDLAVNAVTAPVWVAIDGMAEFVDDSLGINSGSVPYTSGRIGFGNAVSAITRRSLFDHIEVRRQTGLPA